MSTARLDVYLPTRNRAELLRQALDALSAQSLPLEQLRVIVADNASTDHTAEVVASFADRLHIEYVRRDTDIGPADNAARIVEHLESEYFALLSDDDLIGPGLYAVALHALDRRPDAAAYAAATLVGRLDGREAWAPSDAMHVGASGRTDAFDWDRTLWCVLHTAISPVVITGCVIRRAAALAVGTIFEPSVQFYDRWFLARLGARFPILGSRWPQALIRMHADNTFMSWRDRSWAEQAHRRSGELTLGLCAAAGIDVAETWRRLAAEGVLDDGLRAGIYHCYPEALRRSIIGAWRPPRRGRLDYVPIPESWRAAIRACLRGADRSLR
jgi:glycosyltransferase involved in cell wall biosynthesis